MSYTVIGMLIVFTVIVLFSEDFAKLGKKIINLRGMKLFLPLLFASIIVVNCFDIISWILDYFLDKLKFWLVALGKGLPFGSYNPEVIILISLLLTSVGFASITMFMRRYLGYGPLNYLNGITAFFWTMMAVFSIILLN